MTNIRYSELLHTLQIGKYDFIDICHCESIRGNHAWWYVFNGKTYSMGYEVNNYYVTVQ